jgi:hypothetical protein
VAVRGVLEDRPNDDVPVTAVDAVAGALESEQVGAGDLLRERLAVLGREHRVRAAMDDERGHDDRRQRPALAPVVRDQVVVLKRRDVAGTLDLATYEIASCVFVERALTCGEQPRVFDHVLDHRVGV